jgi:hypothetical protein
MRSVSWGALIATLALTGGGCGSKSGLTKVHGTVTLDGTPVENAQVVFFPVEGSTGKHATGRTGPDGAFQLTTTTPNDGAFPGDYKVVVQYEEGAEVPAGKNVKEVFQGIGNAPRKKKPPRYIIPAKYSDLSKTELAQKVPPAAPVELKLQSK